MRTRQEEYQHEIQADALAQQRFLAELSVKCETGDLSYARAQAVLTSLHDSVRIQLQRILDNHAVHGNRGGKSSKWVRNLDLDRAAFILLETMIRNCMQGRGQMNLALLAKRIGKAWEYEENCMEVEDRRPLDLEYFEKNNYGYRRDQKLKELIQRALGSATAAREDEELIQWGQWGLLALREAGIITTPPQVAKQPLKAVLNPEVLKVLLTFEQTDVVGVWDRQEAAMHYPPDPYTMANDGGYISPTRKLRSPMVLHHKYRKSLRRGIIESFTAENLPEVFSAVNYLQSIPYVIHEPTRRAILQVWAAGGGVLSVPRSSLESAPEFPYPDHEGTWTDTEKSVVVEWKIKTKLWAKRRNAWQTQLRDLKQLLKASQYPAEYWFPMFVDYRGRMYYRGYPNPQGTDMAKGVLHFRDKKPLGKRGIFWLKVHIANSYGFDKERMDVRAQWTEDNWDAICKALDHPEDYWERLGDSPWCTFSAAWELREAYRSGRPEEYETGVPVGMDATCSGLQHFSAMLRDPHGGVLVNLTNGDGQGPKQDIYSAVKGWVEEKLRQECLSDEPERAQRASWWLAKGITRSMAKKPVMTYCYSATIRSAAEHCFQEVLPDIESGVATWREPGSGYRDCLYLGRLLFEGIEAMFPKAAEAMAWLRRLTKHNGDKPMQWESPTGFPVVQDCREQTTTALRLRSTGYKFILKRETGGINMLESQNGISPNVVHSLDSAHMAKLANRMKHNGCSLLAVHDCASTHACDVDFMQASIREVFVEMYAGNLLDDLRMRIDPDFEAPPPQGDLDLDQVRWSEFFFS
jgi:phage-specific RNA polymerase|nr:MAG TPA: DNA directed RNA polymerase [Caudoviricetes sp.]